MKQLAPQIPVNCKQLSSDVSMSWVLDDTNNAIIIKLCGCVLVSPTVVYKWRQRSTLKILIVQEHCHWL